MNRQINSRKRAILILFFDVTAILVTVILTTRIEKVSAFSSLSIRSKRRISAVVRTTSSTSFVSSSLRRKSSENSWRQVAIQSKRFLNNKNLFKQELEATSTTLAAEKFPVNSVAEGSSSGDHGTKGTYRLFAEHAFDKLKSSGIFEGNDDFLTEGNIDADCTSNLGNGTIIPLDLRNNNVSQKGSTDTNVNIEIRSLGGSSSFVARNARYALLETLRIPKSDDAASIDVIQTDGIQVLNMVIFPDVNADIPIFGADLVSLPGNRHLIAIDLQPVRVSDKSENEGVVNLSAFHQKKLQKLHDKYSTIFEWGGDIPPKAQRFFSSYAIWTRLTGDDAVPIIQSDIWDVFCDYLDLYIDILKCTKALKSGDGVDEGEKVLKELHVGHKNYLDYRKENDPARPMLQSLYGKEWTERLIQSVLFPILS